MAKDNVFSNRVQCYAIHCRTILRDGQQQLSSAVNSQQSRTEAAAAVETAESRDFSGPASAQKSTDSRWTPFNDGWRQDEQKILNSAEPVLSTADSTLLLLLLSPLALLRTTRSTAQTFAGSVLLRTSSSPPITLGCVPPSLQAGPVLHSRRVLRLSERASLRVPRV